MERKTVIDVLPKYLIGWKIVDNSDIGSKDYYYRTENIQKYVLDLKISVEKRADVINFYYDFSDEEKSNVRIYNFYDRFSFDTFENEMELEIVLESVLTDWIRYLKIKYGIEFS